MKRFNFLCLFLCVAIGMLGFSHAWGAVEIKLGASKTKVAPGGTVELQVITDAKDLCGAALTVQYDATKVDLVTKNGATTIVAGEVDPAEVNSEVFTTVLDKREPPGIPATAVPMAGKNTTTEPPTATATVSLSGAYVQPKGETNEGAGRFTTSVEKKIFGVTFKVKSTVAKDETVVFSVKQTSLYNPSAGWGTETDTTPVPVPPLVGVPTDWASKTNVADQFFNIAATFPGDFSVTVGDETKPGNISGCTGGDDAVDVDDLLLMIDIIFGAITPSDCQKDAGNLVNPTDATIDIDDLLKQIDIIFGVGK